MSSPPSAPPPSGHPAGLPEPGNTKIAIVAVLLLLGAGGLYFWRGASSQPAAPPPLPSAAAAPSTEPTNPKLDDIPLPPPEEEKPEAGPAPKIVYVPAAGCDGKCTGTAPPELEQAIQVRGSQTRRCYNQALSQDSSLKGHVSIAVKIGPSGNLCSATVAQNDMGSPGVANCAANVFRAVQGYPAPHGGCLTVTVPLSFVPQGQ